jgi:hypothetical protein
MNASQPYHIRPARLDDTQSIAWLFQQQIPVWQRVTADGRVENLPYDALTIYERWTHGGPWMSVETGAIHLSRLLRGAGMTMLAERNGQLDAYAEIYPGEEPAPFGPHLHLSRLIYHDDIQSAKALLRALIDLAQSNRIKLTVSLWSGEEKDAELYRDLRLQPLTSVQRHHLPARTGQGFYKVNEHSNSSAAQIEDWQMPVGRLESARQHWEELWPRVWDIMPEIAARQVHRLFFSASGHDAFVYCQQQLNPRSADLYVWSSRTMSSQLLTAIRDWAHRQNYRTLSCVVTPEVAKVLGTGVEVDPITRTTYSIQR